MALVTPEKVTPLAFIGAVLEAGYTMAVRLMLPTHGSQLHVILSSAVVFRLNSSKCIQDQLAASTAAL